MVVPPTLSTPISSDMLMAFLKVAEHLSVSGAATELGVGKSVVSKRIAQLEGKLQTTLFSRSTRKVTLTPSGAAYADHARRALAEMLAGEERLRSMRSELTGRIRLTAPVSWGQRVLARHLPEFLRLHPAIEIDLHLDDTMLDLAGQQLDIALRWSGRREPALSHAPVAPIGWVLAASALYLNSQGRPRRPADLSRHSCMTYWRERSDEAWTLVHTKGRSARVEVRSRYHVDDVDAVTQAAVAGLGIALLPDYLCDTALASGQLETVLPHWSPRTKFGTHIMAVAAPERMALPRNRMLISFLQQQLA